MKVLLIIRDPARGGKSVEGIFSDLYAMFTEKMDVDRYIYQEHKGFWYNYRRIKATGSDLFHITSDMYWLALFLPARRSILTIHDIGHYSGMKGIRRWIYGKWYLQWPAKFAGAITTVSRFTRNMLGQILPAGQAEKVVTIYNPVPLGLRHQAITPVPGNKIVLQVGTNPHKNWKTVIKALKDLPYTMSIIGPLSDEQLKWIGTLGVRYTHKHEATPTEILEAYRMADVVTFVSLYEGFGMPVIEAQAAGRPVITSRKASLPEIAGDGAVFIQDPSDVSEIRLAIIRLMEDEPYRNELLQKGLNNVSRFDAETSCQAYINVYRTLLSEGIPKNEFSKGRTSP